MLKGYTSYGAKKHKKINDKCAKMRKAKERKRLESPPPDYPMDLTGHYRVIHCEDSLLGTHILLLEPKGKSFNVWLDAGFTGKMGFGKALKLIQERYPRFETAMA